MTAKTSVIRGPKDVVVKTRSVTFADTTARQIATLPKGARLLYIVVGGAASNAATTGTLSVGTTATATEWINGFDVKTVATGIGPTMPLMVTAIPGSVMTADTPVFALYGETGTGATAGSWFVSIHYTTGNIVNNDA